MNKSLNCQQLTDAINAIKSKKSDFDEEFSKKNTKCFKLKTELLLLIKELKEEIWPIEYPEFSHEKLKKSYQEFKKTFENNNVIKDGQIPQELLPDSLKGEVFLMPTEEQFLDYIVSKEKQLEKMLKLGLVEPVIVPIAADFGYEIEPTWQFSRYKGLLGIVANKLKKISESGSLNGSDGVVLPSGEKLKQGSCGSDPVYVDQDYEKLQYAFREQDGNFSEDLTQASFIQKHKDAGSPFPGFAIYFKEKGNLLKPIRDKDDPLIDMESFHALNDYIINLRKLYLTGSTVHAELTLLLCSLEKDSRVTRDPDAFRVFQESEDSAGLIAGNLFENGNVCCCYWNRKYGYFCFTARNYDRIDSSTSGIPMDELI